MDKKLLIVGIDPGTTIGYAVLDIEGNLLTAKSSKNCNLSILINELVSIGKTIIIGTDKKKIPDFVEKAGIKLGAKIISPKEDLLVYEKRNIASGFNIKKDHELDALASALFAYNKIKPLMNKIDYAVRNENKIYLKSKVLEIALKKNINIKGILDELEKPADAKVEINKVIVEKTPEKKIDPILKKKKISDSTKELALLKSQNIRLEKSLHKTLKKYSKLKKKEAEQNYDGKFEILLRQKEERIVYSFHELNKKSMEIDELRKKIKGLYSLMADLGQNVLIKKLKDFSSIELSHKNKILNIRQDDILLVEEPNIFSENTLSILKDKVSVVIYKKAPSRKIMEKTDFIFIDCSKLDIFEEEYFAIANKQIFNKEKNKLDVLKKIIDDYKKDY